MKTPACTQRGFTLLELSIVLVLIALILGGALATLVGSIQATQYNKTVERMDNIEKALLNYAIAYNRIPCPADLTLTATGSANYGLEAGAAAGGVATGECVTGMTPAANFKAASGTEEGGLPTRALQLPDDYMYDGWGRKFRYAVDPTYTKSAALPFPAGGLCSASASGITVNDASGAARTTAAIYALISHGANGHGAYTSNGVTLNAGSASADELTNCHCTSAAVAGTYTPTYVEKAPQYDAGQAGNALYSFDDIVTFKEGWQMQAQNYPLAAANTCTLLAVASDASPYVTLYSFSSGNLTMLPAPATPPGNAGYGVDFSPDNSVLAWVGQGASGINEGMLYSVGGSGLTYASTFINSNYDDEAVKFSPDGNYLVAGGDYPYFSAYVKSGGTYTSSGVTISGTPGSSYALAWSPDGSMIYTSSAPASYQIISRSGTTFTIGPNIDLSSYAGGGISALSVHPSGNYIAMGDQNDSALQPLVLKNPSGAFSVITSGFINFGDMALTTAWSPDGTFLAVGWYSSGVFVYGFNSGTDTFTPATMSGNCASGEVKSVAWSKDGNYVAAASLDSTAPLCIFSRSGTTFTRVTVASSLMPPGEAWGVAFTH